MTDPHSKDANRGLTLSHWIPTSTPPEIDGVYETLDEREFVVSFGYQRYKCGYWGSWSPTLSGHKKNYAAEHQHVETAFPPTHWRGVIES